MTYIKLEKSPGVPVDFPNNYVNNLTGLPHSDSTAQTPVYQRNKSMPMFEGTPPVNAGNRIDGEVMPQSLQLNDKMAFAQDTGGGLPAGADFPAMQNEAMFLQKYLNGMMRV